MELRRTQTVKGRNGGGNESVLNVAKAQCSWLTVAEGIDLPPRDRVSSTPPYETHVGQSPRTHLVSV